LDNFLYQYRSHYVLPTAWEEFNLSHPHNLVLDFWLRLGLPGLLILGWLLVGFFTQGFRALHTLAVRAGDSVLLVMGLLAGMAGALSHGLVDNAFFLVDLAFVFVLMLALVQAVGAGETLNSTVAVRAMSLPAARDTLRNGASNGKGKICAS
jgi:putative inorganic carbon (HCO3(-)) transporter